MLYLDADDRQIRGYYNGNDSYCVMVIVKETKTTFENLTNVEQAGLFYILANLSFEDLLEACSQNGKKLLTGLVHFQYHLGKSNLSDIPSWQWVEIDENECED